MPLSRRSFVTTAACLLAAGCDAPRGMVAAAPEERSTLDLSATNQFVAMAGKYDVTVIRKSIGSVLSENEKSIPKLLAGSATLLDEEGHIACCAHQINNFDSVGVTFYPTWNKADLVPAKICRIGNSYAVNEKQDVAILRIIDPDFIKRNGLIPVQRGPLGYDFFRGERMLYAGFFDGKYLHAIEGVMDSFSPTFPLSGGRMALCKTTFRTVLPVKGGMSGGAIFVKGAFGGLLATSNDLDHADFTPAYVVWRMLDLVRGKTATIDADYKAPPTCILDHSFAQLVP